MHDEADSDCPPSTKSPRGSSCHSGILGGREVAVMCDMGGGELHERGSDDAGRSVEDGTGLAVKEHNGIPI